MSARGVILVMTLALMILLVTLVGSFLYAVSVFTVNSGWEETDAKLLGLAEAGLHKAIWNLKTPPSAGGAGEDWTTNSRREDLGEGRYTLQVERWNFALSAHGSSAIGIFSFAPPPDNDPMRTIDGQAGTFWESRSSFPFPFRPHVLMVSFPYPLTINKVSFSAGDSSSRPIDYQWGVFYESGGLKWVATITDNPRVNVTNTFPAESNVRHLLLLVTRTPTGVLRLREVECIGNRITSTGSIPRTGDTLTRTVQQTVIADSNGPENQVAYTEPDWNEL